MANASLNFDQFVAGYIACAAWASGEELDGADYAPETKEALAEQCREFYADPAVAPLLDLASRMCNSSALGHDFWLTRNGHGAGFWDRKELRYQDLGRKLSDLVGFRTNYPECYLYIGEDGLIYLD